MPAAAQVHNSRVRNSDQLLFEWKQITYCLLFLEIYNLEQDEIMPAMPLEHNEYSALVTGIP